MTINERIGLILKEKKLTANEFAASLEVRSSNISHIITGRNKPSFDFLEKLSSVFPDISTLWLIKGDGDMYLSDNKDEDKIEQKEEDAHTVVVNNINKEPNISLQANLFGEIEPLEKSLPKVKKTDPIMKGGFMETENKVVTKVESSKKISSIIVYYSNGSFEELIPKM
ncbi:MAG: helix-turn-helix transcriptional regulator [Rikenellaceae bacterium]